MPIYEYKCRNCENRFEQLVFKSTEKIACPVCGSDEAEKYVSTFSSNAFAGESASCNTGSCSKKSSFG